MRVSLTEFTEFLLAPSPRRAALVKRLVAQASKNSDYNPTLNFWHQLREGFRRYWRDGGSDAAILTAVVERAAEPKKGRFERAIRGFLRFRGRKRLRWEEPPTLHWRYKDLDVACSPDLALTDGTRHWLIRLHYQPVPPSRARVSVTTAVMRMAAARAGKSGAAPALLDLDRGSLRVGPEPRTDDASFEVEADSFIAYWRRYEAS